jgi:hypothetical protein
MSLNFGLIQVLLSNNESNDDGTSSLKMAILFMNILLDLRMLLG